MNGETEKLLIEKQREFEFNDAMKRIRDWEQRRREQIQAMEMHRATLLARGKSCE